MNRVVVTNIRGEFRVRLYTLNVVATHKHTFGSKLHADKLAEKIRAADALIPSTTHWNMEKRPTSQFQQQSLDL